MGSRRRRSLFDGLVILHRFMALSMPTCVTNVWVALDPSRTTCPTHHEINQLQHYQLLLLELSARPRRDWQYDETVGTALTRSSMGTDVMSLLLDFVNSIFTVEKGRDGDDRTDQYKHAKQSGRYVQRSVMIQDEYCAPDQHTKGNEISTEPGDGFLEAFKTLNHDHNDWFLEILKRHRSIRRNAGVKQASGADEAARYDFVMEGTTCDREWKGWLGGDSSKRGYDPGAENTFTVDRETVRSIVRKPSDQSACILSHGPIEDRVSCVVVFEPVEKLKVEQPDEHYSEDEKYLLTFALYHPKRIRSV